MDAVLARLVRQRARNRCEYFQISQEYDVAPFEIDHIISKKHHGLTVASNLALSCFHCNSFKGSNIGGRDLLPRRFTLLFNPRRHKWNRHFHWQGPYLIAARQSAESPLMCSISMIRYASN
jgi:hypothetical protein